MARIPAVPVKEWPAGMRDAMAALTPPNPRYPFPTQDGTRPKGLNVLGTMANHPELATAFHHFNGHVLFWHGPQSTGICRWTAFS